jgi:small subunit ribosomal protein S4
MSKYIGPVCRLCRREGEKLYLKASRCLSPKCAIEKRNFPPGQHGKDGQFKRNRSSDYLLQLREKQKARRVYGVLEAQFRRYYTQALKSRGVTGQVLLQMLERRLDNVVYRLGFAGNRAQARNLVTHGHFNVNGRRTDVPSLIVEPGDVIEVRPGSQRRTYFSNLKGTEETSRSGIPGWLAADKTTLAGKVLRHPAREEIDANLNEQLIVEYYSR